MRFELLREHEVNINTKLKVTLSEMRQGMHEQRNAQHLTLTIDTRALQNICHHACCVLALESRSNAKHCRI